MCSIAEIFKISLIATHHSVAMMDQYFSVSQDVD